MVLLNISDSDRELWKSKECHHIGRRKNNINYINKLIGLWRPDTKKKLSWLKKFVIYKKFSGKLIVIIIEPARHNKHNKGSAFTTRSNKL